MTRVAQPLVPAAPAVPTPPRPGEPTDWSALLQHQPSRRWRHVPALAGVLAAHALLGWALLQVDVVRQSVAQAAPLLIDFVTVAPPKPEPPRPTPPRRVERPKPTPSIVAAPAPEPAPLPLAAPPMPPEPAPPTAAVEPPRDSAPPAPAPPAPPRTIAATAVQYLRPPAPIYPAMSRRLGESGRVVLKVLVGEDGLPRQIVVQQSSGHPRLDAAAVDAMKDARFKPYTENGIAQRVWAPAPIAFDLE